MADSNIIYRVDIDGNASAKLAAMATQVESINKDFIQTKGAIDGVNSELSESVGIINQLKAKENELTKARDAANNTADIKKFNAELRRTQGEIAKLTQSGGAFSNAFKNAFAQISIAAGAFVGFEAIKSGIGSVIQFATEAETTAVSFEVLLGSAEKAQSVLKSLTDFAATTPFELPEVQDAARKLLAFGIESDKLEPSLRALGDISAGVGAPIGEIAELYGKARVQGRLFSEDINQLTGRGIPIIQELAKQFGVTDSEVKKLVESGQVGFGNIEKAFVALSSSGGKFFDLMNKQSQTTAGQFSNLADSFKGAARDLGTALLPAINELIQFGLTLITVLRAIPKFVTDNSTAFKLLGAALIAFNAHIIRAQVITLFANAMTVLRNATIATTVATKGLTTALRANPIGVVTGLILTAAAAWSIYTDNQSEAVQETDNLNDKLKDSEATIKAEFDNLTRLTEASKTDVSVKLERQQAIDTINQKYGQYLPNLLTEATTTEQIAAAYERVNRALARRIIEDSFAEKRKEVIKEQVRLTDQLVKLQQQADDLVANRRTGRELKATVDAIEQTRGAIANLDDRIKDLNKQRDLLLAKFADPTLAIEAKKASEKELKEAAKAADDRVKIASELEKDLIELEKKTDREFINEKLKQLEIIQDASNEFIAEIEKALKKQAITESEANDFRLRALNAFEAQRTKIAQEEAKKRADSLKKIDEDIAEFAGSQKILTESEKVFADIRAKQLQLVGEIKAELAKGLISESDATNRITATLLAAGSNIDKAIQSLPADFISLNIAQKIATDFEFTDAQRMDIILKAKKNLQALAQNPEFKRLLISIALPFELQLQLNLDGLKADAFKAESLLGQIFGGKGLTEKKDKFLKGMEDGAAQVFEASVGLANEILSAQTAFLDTLISNQQRQVDAIQAGLNEAQGANNKYTLEELKQNKRRLMELEKQKAEALRRRQTLAIVEIAIESAVAIAKAAAEGGAAAPFTIAATLIALAAGIAAAQAQAQSAVPTAAEGGIVGEGNLVNVKHGGELKGRSHAQGGIMIEAEGGERIFDKKRSAAYKPLFERIATMPIPAFNFNPKAINEYAHTITAVPMYNDAKLNEVVSELRAVRKQLASGQNTTLVIQEGRLHSAVMNVENRAKRIDKLAR